MLSIIWGIVLLGVLAAFLYVCWQNRKHGRAEEANEQYETQAGLRERARDIKSKLKRMREDRSD
jgi:predicted negative regulator of RcsB-dependent stress response